MKNYRPLLEEINAITNKNLEEGAFGDIIASVKVSTALAKLAQKMQRSIDPKNSAESVRVEFKKMLNNGLKLIEQSKMSPDMKESFKEGFLGGMFGRLKEIVPEYSGNDMKKSFDIPDDIYRKMVTSYAQQKMKK